MQFNENGDVEQSNHRFKRALDQALMLRGSRDFTTLNDYKAYLQQLFDQLNAGRSKRFQEELPLLKSLPQKRLDDKRLYKVRVGRSSTINILNNTYSVHSRLIKENVEVRVGAEHLEIWYAQKKVDEMLRLHGDGKHRVNYRHVIDWLVRKPGAFENYRYKSSMPCPFWPRKQPYGAVLACPASGRIFAALLATAPSQIRQYIEWLSLSLSRHSVAEVCW